MGSKTNTTKRIIKNLTKMMRKKMLSEKHSIFGMFFLCILGANAYSRPLISEIQEFQVERIEHLSENQSLIENISMEIDDATLKHENNVKEIDSLKIYNSLLEEQIFEQEMQIRSSALAIEDVAILERKISPLFVDMITTLKRLIVDGLPFLLGERKDRIEKLERLVRKPQVSIGEKYYKILEAYQIENQYGKTLETYLDTITIKGVRQQVDILRVGRIGLFFRSKSGSTSGTWNSKIADWTTIEDSQSKRNILKAINIAKKQDPPELIILPFYSKPSIATVSK